MPGNEISIVKFLIEYKNHIFLKYLGKISKIHTPTKDGLIELQTVNDVDNYQKADSSQKKADIYINNIGISLKQRGGSKAFNKFQRKWAFNFFNYLDFDDIEIKISNLDKAVNDFHNGLLQSRNYPWKKIFTEDEFKKLLRHLMMKGNQHADSEHPAEYIITADKIPDLDSLKLYSFDDYFIKNKNSSSIAIRRVWTNMASKSESGRAKSISRDPGNKNWVFDNIVGNPSSGFNKSEAIKKTVYYLDIEIRY